MAEKNNILVLNCGSSSLKFAVINSQTTETALSGLAERLNTSKATITFKRQGSKQTYDITNGYDHLSAIKMLVTELKRLDLQSTIQAIGHRVVHGGEAFTHSAIINDTVIEAIKKTSSLAPLHNPANLQGIEAAQESFPDLSQVAVFDTAFHQTMPKKAYLYAIDRKLYELDGLRRYGFHGTSHYYVANQAANALNQQFNNTSVITVHLGNGCSICAVENGQSVDTSLGMTPVEGLVMGTRSGDVDPGLIVYLMQQKGLSTAEVDDLLNKQSGLLGLSKISNDCRTLEEALESNNEQHAENAKLALDVFSYRVAKYIASYTSALTHLDSIVFTGGIGENSDYIRAQVCSHLTLLGVEIEQEQNELARFGKSGLISADSSRFKVMVIPTNEELVIAQDAANLTQQQ